MAKKPKLIERVPRSLEDISKNKSKNSKPKHNWREDKHPYYRLMEEKGISVTQMYRKFQIPQASLNNIVNYRDSYLKSLVEMKLVIPSFDLLEYIVNYIEENKEKFKNADLFENFNFDQDIARYYENNELAVTEDDVKQDQNHSDAYLREKIEKKNAKIAILTKENKELKELSDEYKVKLRSAGAENAKLVIELDELKSQSETSIVLDTTEKEKYEAQISELKSEIGRLKANQKQQVPKPSLEAEKQGIENFFNNLEKMFKQSGLSQRAFVAKHGLPRTSTGNYLKRASTPTLEAITNFSEKLGIDMTVEEAVDE